MQDRHRQLIPYIIIALFVAAQLVVLLIFGYTPYPDSEGYIRLSGDSLTYGEPYPVSHQLNELAFIWNIGAINATALSLYLFHSIVPLLIVYSLMQGGMSWLIYTLTRTLFNPQIALTALSLYVLYPANYGQGTSLLSETPFMFFTFLALFFAICKNQTATGGALLGFANWFRPMGIVFLSALMIHFLPKQRKAAITLLVSYALMLVTIGGICRMRTGHFVYQAQTGWMALLQYSVDNTPDPSDDHLPEIKTTNTIEKNAIWMERTLKWIASHPTDYLKQMPAKLLNTFVSDNVNMCVFISDKSEKKYLYEELSMKTLKNSFPNWNAVQWFTGVNLIYYYILLLAGILGAFLLHKKRRKKLLVLPLSVIILSTLTLLFFGHGEARFHQPMMPFFIMLAAAFTDAWRKQRTLAKTKSNSR